MTLPLQVFWIDLSSDENVHVVLRKHPLRMVSIILLLLGEVLLIILALVFRSHVIVLFHPWIFWLALTTFAVIFNTFLYFLFIAVILDTVTVTNMRVYFLDQRSIFSQSMTSVPLSSLTSVTAEKSGLLESMFDYGTITLTNTHEKIILTLMPHPFETVKDIDRVMKWATKD